MGSNTLRYEASRQKAAIVYRFFDASGQLLYVGSTVGRVTSRMKDHKRRPWVAEIARTEVTHWPTRSEALIEERRAVVEECPLHNSRLPVTPMVCAIGARIRRRRLDLALGQDELAQLLKVRQRTVSAWETGESTPSMHVIPRIAAVLCTTPGWLAFGEEANRIPAAEAA